MERYKIDTSRQAEKDVEEIFRYIAHELKQPETASKQVERIYESFQSLSEMPQRYVMIDDPKYAKKPIRKMIIDNFFVFTSFTPKASA